MRALRPLPADGEVLRRRFLLGSPCARPVSAKIPGDGGVLREVIAGSLGPGLAGGDAVIRGDEGELRAQVGTRAAGAVKDDPAAERLHAVLQAGQAGTAGP